MRSRTKKKKEKELKTISETSGTTLNAPTFELWGPRRRREKERV